MKRDKEKERVSKRPEERESLIERNGMKKGGEERERWRKVGAPE